MGSVNLGSDPGPDTSARTGWWSRYAAHQKKHVVHHALAALAVANVVLLTEPAWTSLSDLVGTYSQAVAAEAAKATQPESTLASAAIVKIDEARFQRPVKDGGYGGNSPLDRCALARDLAVLLQQPLESLTVDLDLSPAAPRADNPASGCQDRLDQLLLDASNAKRLVLMAPAPAQGVLGEDIKAWTQRMQDACISFGSVELRDTRGQMLHLYRGKGEVEMPPLSDLIRARLAGGGARCASVGADKAAELEAQTLIRYQALTQYHQRGGDSLTLSHPCWSDQTCSIKHVVLGAGYSNDDTFQTPIGPVHGVDVHAALAACPVQTALESTVWHLVLHLAEVLIGALLFAPVFHTCWKRYYSTAGAKVAAPATGAALPGSAVARWLRLNEPASAFVWLYAMALFVLLALGLQALLLPLLSGVCKVFALPAAFFLGLAIEAAVVQGREGGTGDSAAHHAPPWSWAPYRLLGWPVYLALCVLALSKMHVF